MRSRGAIVLALALSSPGVALAQTQIQVPVQGVLTDAQGTPLQETVSLTFSLYANATTATPLWREVQQIEIGRVFPGVYDVRLGAVTPLGAELFRDNPTIQLGIRVANDTADIGRWPISTTPKSAHSELATNATGGGSADFGVLDPRYVNVAGDSMSGRLILPQGGLQVATNTLVIDTSGQIGIGTAIPTQGFEVTGRVSRLDGRNAAGLRLDLAGTADFTVRETATDDIVQLGTIYDNISSTAVGIGRAPAATGNIRLDVNGDVAILGQSVAALDTTNNVRTLSLGDVIGGDGLIDNLDLRTRDGARMRIDPSGNVGVGILGPDARLTVMSAQAASAAILNLRSGATRDVLRVETDANANGLVRLKNASELDRIYLSAAGDSWFNGGNLAIGRTTASYRLHVEGAVSGTSLCIGTDCRTSWAAVTGEVDWTRAGAVVRLANATDSVGIGLDSPRGKVHIAGADSRSTPVVIESDSPGLYFFDSELLDGSVRYASFGIEVDGSSLMIGSRPNTMAATPGTTSRTFRLDSAGNVFMTGALDVNNTMVVGRHELGNARAYRLDVRRGGTSTDPGTFIGGSAISAIDYAADGPAAQDNIGLVHASYPRISETDTNAENATVLTALNDSGTGLRVSARGNVYVGSYTQRAPAQNRGLFVEGNVGIGNTAPQWKTDIVGDLQVRRPGGGTSNSGENVASLNFKDTTTNTWWHWSLRGNSDLWMHVRPNGQTAPNVPMVLTSSGRLGVNTESPAERLHVAGNARVDGTLIVNGAIQPSSLTTSGLVNGGTVFTFGDCAGNGTWYSCSIPDCYNGCRSRGGRMMTETEAYAYAAGGNNFCSYAWLLQDGGGADMLFTRAFPMSIAYPSGGCGRTNTGAVPRLEGVGRGYTWGAADRWSCMCITVGHK